MNVSWDDFRIAHQVAESGSLSGAGKQLQMNHATVLRHVNQLEQALGVKLFIRHQRGYRLTDAGQLMLAEMPDIQRHFTRLENRLSNVEGQISGNLKITTVVSAYSSYLYPGFKAFRDQYPQLRLQLIATDEIIALDQGAAHVSIRVGPKPNGPDLIVKKLTEINTRYYAAKSYIKRMGMPNKLSELNQHEWAMPSSEKHHIPFIKALLKHIEPEQIVYQSNNFPDVHMAVVAGIGIGPFEDHEASKHPQLVKIPVEFKEYGEALWFVYHKDLKDSVRIKALYDYITKYL
jgi:DNA-binding transcriptional LysR family regulator